MLTVAKAAEEAVGAVTKAAEAMGCTDADAKASVRRAEAAQAEVDAQRDEVDAVSGKFNVIFASEFASRDVRQKPELSPGSDRSTERLSYSAALANPAKGPPAAPHINLNPLTDFATSPVRDGVWTVTTRLSHPVEYVRKPQSDSSVQSSPDPGIGHESPSHASAGRSDSSIRMDQPSSDAETWVLRA